MIVDTQVIANVEIPPQADIAMRSNRWVGLVAASPSAVTAMTVNCPKQGAYRLGLLKPKTPFTDSRATLEGKEIHKAAENYLKMRTPFQPHITAMAPSLQARLDLYLQMKGFDRTGVERTFAVNEHGPCNRGVHAAMVQSDLIVDQQDSHHLLYTDYKSNGTHNARGEYKEPKLDEIQTEMTAVLAFMSDPKLVRVTVIYEFVRHQANLVATFHRDDPKWKVYSPKDEYGKREQVAEHHYAMPSFMHNFWYIQRQQMFEAKQSGLCGAYCDVLGCEFNGKRAKT